MLFSLLSVQYCVLKGQAEGRRGGVMVFVHARNSTVRTCMTLIEMAKNRGESSFFQPDQGPDYGHCEKQVSNTTHLISV
ncbi:activating signal cointegrator 1 complex subunit 3 [Tachysurus ichikawai]